MKRKFYFNKLQLCFGLSPTYWIFYTKKFRKEGLFLSSGGNGVKDPDVVGSFDKEVCKHHGRVEV